MENELSEINKNKSFWLGPLTIWKNIREHHYLISNFIQRDLRLKYRNSLLGYFWSLLEPLMLSGVYFVLFVIIKGSPEPNYPLWVILGVIVWGHFSQSLNGSITSLTQNSELIKQVYFPREIFAITKVGSNLIIAMLGLFVAVPFMYYLDISPNEQLLMVPLGLILVSMLSLGVGLLLACLNTVNRDIEHFFRFVTRAGFFLSPVMWTVEMVSANALKYILINPMVVPITMIRNGIDGKSLGIESLYVTYSILFCTISLLLGCMVFKYYEARVVKKL
jgi:ABC-type polysaccharide/polyol phosphate export permease